MVEVVVGVVTVVVCWEVVVVTSTEPAQAPSKVQVRKRRNEVGADRLMTPNYSPPAINRTTVVEGPSDPQPRNVREGCNGPYNQRVVSSRAVLAMVQGSAPDPSLQ